MLAEKTTKLTTVMIFGGTFLLSVLSFVTTLYGMLIIVPLPLAVIGSLGLQAAMLGIAWNLIRIQESRWKYSVVFSIAAFFSIFFSYANFDINIKAHIRPREARHAYYEAARATLIEYTTIDKKAVAIGRYQVDRLIDLIKMEEQKGWATISDEGSRDKFLQSIIDGARLAVESWRASQGNEYQQGKGRGLIVNYLESRLAQARQNYVTVCDYQNILEDIIARLNGELPVAEQYALVNRAFVSFPLGEIEQILMESELPLPPPHSPTDYAESPSNGQQALNMVIDDLRRPDSLTLFALILAAAIDFIVLLMALAGGYAAHSADLLLDKLDKDIQQRIEKASFDDPRILAETLQENVNRYQTAANYSLDLIRLMAEYKTARENYRLVLKRRKDAVKSAMKGDIMPTLMEQKTKNISDLPEKISAPSDIDGKAEQNETGRHPAYESGGGSRLRHQAVRRSWGPIAGWLKKNIGGQNIKSAGRRNFDRRSNIALQKIQAGARRNIKISLSASGRSFDEKSAKSSRTAITPQ